MCTHLQHMAQKKQFRQTDLQQDDCNWRRQQKHTHLDRESSAEQQQGQAPATLHKQEHGNIGQEHGDAIIEQS